MRTTNRRSQGAVAFRRSPVYAAVAMALAQGATAATFTVTNNADSGTGSLRQAISDANADCTTNGATAPVINFSGPFTISPSMPLPSFSCFGLAYTPTVDTGGSAVIVDGTTAANNSYGGCMLPFSDNGYGGRLTVKGLQVNNFNAMYGGGTGLCGIVTVTGSRFIGNQYGIQAHSGSIIGGSVADRNIIANSLYHGIDFDGAVTIDNNYIGTIDGSTAAANGSGVYFSCCTSPTGSISNNVIVTNGGDGINVSYDSYGGTLLIANNKIGTDAAGTTLLGTSSYGISLWYSYGAQINGNTIGGGGEGIDSYSGSNVAINGNMIGVNATGTAALANSLGIYDSWSTGTQVTGNVVSGNTGIGVHLYNAASATVSGNKIGTDASGSSGLANDIGLVVDTSNGAIVANNTVSGNANMGIFVIDSNAVQVTSNTIGSSTVPNTFGLIADCSESLSIDGNTISGNRSNGAIFEAVQASSIAGNSVSGNGAHGVYATYLTCGSVAYGLAVSKSIVGGGANNESDGNTFSGNVISGNGGHGLFIEGGSNNNLFQNTVRNNTTDGIRIDNHYDVYGGVITVAVGNTMHEGPTYANGAKNLNLGFDGGPAPHQLYTADVSMRPNHWQNAPTITSVVRDTLKNNTTVGFDLESPAGTYRIDVYSNGSPAKPGGDTYISNTYVTLAYGGIVSGSYAFNGTTLDNISLTASRDDTAPRDTSEFSAVVAATTLPVPAVSISPTSIDFGSVVVSRSSGSGTITITSTGTAPYVINTMADGSYTSCPIAVITSPPTPICSSGAFACSTTCTFGTQYSAPSSCVITAAFSPSTTGTQSHTISWCDNTSATPQQVTFTGNGINPPVVDISMSPASFSFGEVLVGTQSPSHTFTVSNAGSNSVYLGPVTTTGDFSLIANSCGTTLAGGATCSADVVFHPLSKGLVTATVAVTGSTTPPPAALRAGAKATTAGATNTARAVLSGTGLQYGDLRLPAAMSFGTTVLHGPALQQGLLIANTGNGDLTISSVAVSGPFTIVNACPATLPSGNSCTVTVSFDPASLGAFSGTLTVVSDAPGGSRGIALSANVIAQPKPVVTFSPISLGFGDRVVGSSSTSQRITITNEGAQEATLGTPTVTGTSGSSDFLLTHNCGPTLAPQATCAADIVMKPLEFGPLSATFTIPSNTSGDPPLATLSGRGCRPFSAGANRSLRDPCEK